MEIVLIVFISICLLLIWRGFKSPKKEELNNKEAVIEFGYEKPKDIGFPNIKVVDEFEGFACGHYFTNQIAREVNGDNVFGTTDLVVFSKDYIRPIRDNAEPIQFYSKGLSTEQVKFIKEQRNIKQ